MKIALIFGETLIAPRPFDFASDPLSNARGLTGSEMSLVRVAQEFLKMGHDVSLYTMYIGEKPANWEGIKLYTLSEKNNITSNFDAIISWCEPDQFRGLPTEPVRLCLQQVGGFSYCQPGFDDFVDIWAALSNSHMNYQIKNVEIQTHKNGK